MNRFSCANWSREDFGKHLPRWGLRNQLLSFKKYQDRGQTTLLWKSQLASMYSSIHALQYQLLRQE